MPTPTTQHPEIVSYPTIVYQKSPVPPGYIAVPVASEEEVLALTGGPVFLTAENAMRYQPPPEQPFPDFKRTDNIDQFDARKSVMGVATPEPVTRENPVANTYVRTGPPDPLEPPEEPPATQSAPAQQPSATTNPSASETGETTS